MVSTRQDSRGRTEVWVDGQLVGRILPKHCGTWAAAPTGADIRYFDTHREAVSALIGRYVG